MRCHQAELWISTAIDGEPLSAPVRVALDAHLTGCADCREFSQRERERSALLAGILAPRRPERAADAILLAVRSGRLAEEGAPGRVVLRRRLTMAAAAAVLAAGALLGLRLGEWTLPGGPSRAASVLEPDRPRPEVPAPFHLIGDETEWTPVPGADGSPWGKETRRVRGVLFRPRSGAGFDEGARPELPGFEFEIQGTRYQRLDDFPEE